MQESCSTLQKPTAHTWTIADKRYTFILKDELLPRNPDNGRDQATISWEYDFKPCFGESSLEKGGLLFVPWSGLKPTYRGKEKEHADPINLKTIKRMSIMMRSFFGDQEGPFSLTLRSISAVASSPVEPGKLERGDAASATNSTSQWSRYTQSFTAALSSWRICGLTLAAIALYYLHRSTSPAA
ncbi:CIA30-domain-containing protein [Aureobasidium sp. EXF-8846]|nr:CIA30-domain-containing protein [Aureobasidium sp. EXF-8846]